MGGWQFQRFMKLLKFVHGKIMAWNKVFSNIRFEKREMLKTIF